MNNYLCWSGGKDSTASLIICKQHNIPLNEVVFVEVMYSHEKKISGENPEHIDWIYNDAIPLIKSWGYKVTVLKDKEDYESLFLAKVKRSKVDWRINKIRGFPIANRCIINDRLKMRPLLKYFSTIGEHTEIVGIAFDEKKRLERLKGKYGKVSVLEDYKVTECEAYELCDKYNLLSPIYKNNSRGGCWFCPNCKIKEFAQFAKNHPLLWKELGILAQTENLISKKFKYNESFYDINSKIFLINNQISFFDGDYNE